MCLQPDTAEAHVGLPASYFTHKVISQDILQCSSLSITAVTLATVYLLPQWFFISCLRTEAFSTEERME